MWRGNLTFRISVLLLAGFVLIQLVVLGATMLQGPTIGNRSGVLPPPGQVAAMADALDRAPPWLRSDLLAVFDTTLYHTRLDDALLHAHDDPGVAALARAYRTALPGRTVTVTGREPMFRRLATVSPWRGRLLSPLMLSVSLRSGTVVIDSRPSAMVRGYLRQRALIGALGGLFILVGLVLAVWQTMRPLTRLAAGIRQFANRLDAPDLPVIGSSELRDLSSAYNEMKARIAALMAERTRILAAVAHDMRTYLTRLRLRAEFIEDGDQRVRVIRDLAEMAGLLDDTLLFAKAEAEGPAPMPALDLVPLLAAIVQIREELGQPVSLTAPRGPLNADVAPLALRRMLDNLIDNALRYSPVVQIEAHETPNGSEIVVLDEGPGVPVDVLAELGEPFGRLDPSRDRSTGGAGLGLAIVAALAAQCGGSVRYANRPEGGFAATILLRKANDES